ncbi:MAG: VWA domain-containing protein, partial [Acidimicrobiia bacterium]
SIGRLVTTAGERLATLAEGQRPGTVIVGIMTDGHENASHEYRYADVKALIERQTDEFSWQFLYMGADQDAIEVGARLGVDADHALTYSRDNVGQAMMSTSDNMRTYRAARSAGVAPQEARRRSRYTDDQRRRSGS